MTPSGYTVVCYMLPDTGWFPGSSLKFSVQQELSTGVLTFIEIFFSTFLPCSWLPIYLLLFFCPSCKFLLRCREALHVLWKEEKKNQWSINTFHPGVTVIGVFQYITGTDSVLHKHCKWEDLWFYIFKFKTHFQALAHL